MKNRCKIVIGLLCLICVLQCLFVLQSCSENKAIRKTVDSIVSDINKLKPAPYDPTIGTTDTPSTWTIAVKETTESVILELLPPATETTYNPPVVETQYLPIPVETTYTPEARAIPIALDETTITLPVVEDTVTTLPAPDVFSSTSLPPLKIEPPKVEVKKKSTTKKPVTKTTSKKKLDHLEPK
jgi:hypothetical protein